jgi:hypothetical protein
VVDVAACPVEGPGERLDKLDGVEARTDLDELGQFKGHGTLRGVWYP